MCGLSPKGDSIFTVVDKCLSIYWFGSSVSLISDSKSYFICFFAPNDGQSMDVLHDACFCSGSTCVKMGTPQKINKWRKKDK